MAKDIRDNKALEIVLIVGCIAMSVLIFVLVLPFFMLPLIPV